MVNVQKLKLKFNHHTQHGNGDHQNWLLFASDAKCLESPHFHFHSNGRPLTLIGISVEFVRKFVRLRLPLLRPNNQLAIAIERRQLKKLIDNRKTETGSSNSTNFGRVEALKKSE